MKTWMILFFVVGCSATAQEMPSDAEEMPTPLPVEAQTGDQVSRDPAGIEMKKTDQELRVMAQLPEALVKKDSRSIQNEVYKTMFNKEMKPDHRDDTLDE